MFSIIVVIIQNMQIRAFKLPPLPGRKAPPVQVMKRADRLFEQEIRTPCYSKDRRNVDKQNIRYSINKRPSSVRSVSRQSKKSQQSAEEGHSSREKSVQMMKDRINHNVKARVSMPSVSAKSWAIFQMKQSKLIYGKRMFKSREIASLTKMMNMITIIELMDEYKLAPVKIRIKVSRDSSCMIGTSAQLKQHYELSLYDLYFGMMLPSGNDAAYQIAQVGGSLLLMIKNQGQVKKQIIYNANALTQYCLKHQNSVNIYLAHMNRVSKRIEMTNSHFANPHGLSNPDNYSCAEDLCKLCTYCMENEIFRFVVRTQSYSADVKHEYYYQQQVKGDNQTEEGIIKRLICDKLVLKWENTNKMLKQGWSGIKTGITPNAGPCLAASVQKFLNGRNLEFLVILLDSASMDHRWKQVRQIVEWVIEEKIYF